MSGRKAPAAYAASTQERSKAIRTVSLPAANQNPTADCDVPGFITPNAVHRAGDEVAARDAVHLNHTPAAQLQYELQSIMRNPSAARSSSSSSRSANQANSLQSANLASSQSPTPLRSRHVQQTSRLAHFIQALSGAPLS